MSSKPMTVGELIKLYEDRAAWCLERAKKVGWPLDQYAEIYRDAASDLRQLIAVTQPPARCSP